MSPRKPCCFEILQLRGEGQLHLRTNALRSPTCVEFAEGCRDQQTAKLLSPGLQVRRRLRGNSAYLPRRTKQSYSTILWSYLLMTLMRHHPTELTNQLISTTSRHVRSRVACAGGWMHKYPALWMVGFGLLALSAQVPIVSFQTTPAGRYCSTVKTDLAYPSRLGMPQALSPFLSRYRPTPRRCELAQGKLFLNLGLSFVRTASCSSRIVLTSRITKATPGCWGW